MSKWLCSGAALSVVERPQTSWAFRSVGHSASTWTVPTTRKCSQWGRLAMFSCC